MYSDHQPGLKHYSSPAWITIEEINSFKCENGRLWQGSGWIKSHVSVYRGPPSPGRYRQGEKVLSPDNEGRGCDTGGLSTQWCSDSLIGCISLNQEHRIIHAEPGQYVACMHALDHIITQYKWLRFLWMCIDHCVASSKCGRKMPF